MFILFNKLTVVFWGLYRPNIPYIIVGDKKLKNTKS